MIFTPSDIGSIMQPFAIRAILNKGTVDERCLIGVFDQPSKDYEIDSEGFAAQTNDVTFKVKAADALCIMDNDTVFVNQKLYRVSTIQDDESVIGYKTLILIKK